jgi:hypothetical protein
VWLQLPVPPSLHKIYEQYIRSRNSVRELEYEKNGG